MTKHQEFKQRFVAVLRDMQQSGSRDPAAMSLVGGLAASFATNLKTNTWSEAKAAMSEQAHETLLKILETEGVKHIEAGRDKHAYATQILAVSMIARRMRADPEMQAGEELLDQIIDYTVAVHRSVPPTLN